MRGFSNPSLLPKIRSRALLDACRYMPCTLRIASLVPGHRCSDDDTVVPCHIPTIGKGMGTKVSDLYVAAGCRACHDLLDGRDNRIHWIEDKAPGALAERIMRAGHETQAYWIGMGLLTAVKMELVQ